MSETKCRIRRLSESYDNRNGAFPMRAILLWFLGIPIPVIILLYLFGVL